MSTLFDTRFREWTEDVAKSAEIQLLERQLRKRFGGGWRALWRTELLAREGVS